MRVFGEESRLGRHRPRSAYCHPPDRTSRRKTPPNAGPGLYYRSRVCCGDRQKDDPRVSTTTLQFNALDRIVGVEDEGAWHRRERQIKRNVDEKRDKQSFADVHGAYCTSRERRVGDPYRFFHIGLEALHAGRGPGEVCAIVVPFFTAALAVFVRRRTRAGCAAASGGRPALGDRRGTGALPRFAIATSSRAIAVFVITPSGDGRRGDLVGVGTIVHARRRARERQHLHNAP